jgi:integrase
VQESITTKTAREKLRPRGKPYFKMLERGVALGYRKLSDGRPGAWTLRKYDPHTNKYTVRNLATAAGVTCVADDVELANGTSILSFGQALDAARKAKDGSAGPYTVADAINDYIRFLESDNRSAKTILVTKQRINAFILPALGKRTVDRLTSDELRSWRDKLVATPARKRSPAGTIHHRALVTDEDHRKRRSSVNRVMCILTAALNHSFREGRVESDGAWRRVKPLRSAGAARVRYLSPDEARRLIAACDGSFRLLVQIGLTTGARWSEIIRLTAADFDRRAGTLHIRQSKSGKERHIVLNDEGRRLLEEITRNRIGLLFPEWKTPHRPMAEACARAGITGVTFHILRHTWASLSIMGGMSLMVAAKNLGHSDTRMVQSHYGHLAEDYITAEVRRAAPSFGFK